MFADLKIKIQNRKETKRGPGPNVCPSFHDTTVPVDYIMVKYKVITNSIIFVLSTILFTS